MLQDSIQLDLRALSVYDFALRELDNSTDEAYLDFANKVIKWFESHWKVSDDYTSFYPLKHFRRKNDFEYGKVISELQDILDCYTAMVAFQLTKAGE